VSTIAILTGDEGHLSIAQAVAAVLQPTHEVKIFFHRGMELDAYAYAYRYLPAAYGAMYQLSQNTLLTELSLKLVSSQKRRALMQFLTETKPDLCICTYLWFLPILADYRAKTKTPLINVVTDPWTLHPAILSNQVDAQLVFDDHAAEVANKLQPTITHQAIGWFVRPNFAPLKTSQSALRAKLGLKDMFTLFVSGGSEGSAMILKLLPALLSAPKPIQVVVTSGHNKQLHTLTKQLNRLFQRLQGKVHLMALPFTPDLSPYLQAADLVAGKAGPNTLFETVAVHKPFIAIAHIPGQEEGNLDLIKKYQLGFVEENPLRLKKLLHRLIKSPQQLEKLQPTIQALASFNRHTSAKLLTLVADLTHPDT
jgi:UDP-N-acetylglucosamine:LPS N-acetylglucosamine transferase